MAEIAASGLFCLICDSNLEVASCVNIFYTSLPRYGELLASFVLRVLRPAESELRSSYICSRCYNLFQMLEQAQWTAANIRSEILKVYRSSERRKDIKGAANSNIETVLNAQNELFVESFDQDDKLEITSTISHLRDLPELRLLNEVSKEGIEHRSVAGNRFMEQSLESSDTRATVNVNNSEIINEASLKQNLEASLVTADVSTCVNMHVSQTIPVKTEKSNLNRDCKSIAGNGALRQTLDLPHRILKQENFKDSLKDDTVSTAKHNVSSLSRQEKMALYTHQCRVCGRLFKSMNNLQSHLLKHGGSRPYECKICDERFSTMSLANIHSGEKHVDNKSISIATTPCEGEVAGFENDDCIFPEEVLRMSDDEEHDDFVWKEVDHTMESDEKLENIRGSEHEQVIEISKELPSESPKGSWKSGRISKYSLKPLKHSCPVCEKKWRTSAELKTHMKSHSSLRPYMCEKCGQAYKHKHALEIHVGMHNGINPFQCRFCNKCFTQKGALMRHLPMHTGETPYQCELCGKRFVHHTSYNMHALSHTGKKSYRCHVCDLSLLSTSHLKRHMRVHTGEKPYSCSLCGKRFAERYNLFAHQKIHDPLQILAKEAKKAQFKCEQCVVLFDKKQKLDDHMKLHHNLGTESGSDRKWVGHTIDIEPQEMELSKFYSSQNQNQNQNPIKSDICDNIAVGQA